MQGPTLPYLPVDDIMFRKGLDQAKKFGEDMTEKPDIFSTKKEIPPDTYNSISDA